MQQRMLTLSVLAIAMTVLSATSRASAVETFFIDEVTDFGNGCNDLDDVNDITSSLKTALINAGWTGTRFANASAWPQDLWEGCSNAYGTGGLDGTYGDTKYLTVYAGHGSRRTIYYGAPHNSVCNSNLSTNMRLGAMNGATAGFAMWLACEVLNSDDLAANMKQSMRQQAGFENTIAIGDNEPRDFFDATVSKSNADAWLDQMGGSGRHAIIATFHRDSSWNCWDVHNRAKLKGKAFNWTMGGGAACGGGQPKYYYCAEERE